MGQKTRSRENYLNSREIIATQKLLEVTVTPVNHEIWAPLNAAQRKADLHMTNLQQILQQLWH